MNLQRLSFTKKRIAFGSLLSLAMVAVLGMLPSQPVMSEPYVQTEIAINPLTGLPIENVSVLQRRPLAIKISNAPSVVRPQAGLGMADIVFEHYVEGFLTRFTAIFYSQTPAFVGSVRSARLVDLQIPLMTDALFAFSGANGITLQRINNSPFADRTFDSGSEPYFFRDETIEVPHNLFAVPIEIWQRAGALGINEPLMIDGLLFDAAIPIKAASVADNVVIDYRGTVAEWRYDFATRAYLRWTDGEPHRDALTGQQIHAENVVIIWTHHQEDLTVIASERQGNVTYAFELQIWTLGPVTVFRDGVRYDGWWHRWHDEDMLTFWRDEDMREPLPLKPGITWFQMVPLDFSGLIVLASVVG